MAITLLSCSSEEGEVSGRMGAHQGGGVTHRLDEASLVALGRQVFADHCVVCHGQAGAGGIGPDLTRPSLKYGKTQQALTATITNGRPGGMPAFRNVLPPERIEAVVHYVRSL